MSNDDQLIEHLDILLEELKNRLDQPIYKLFPDTGDYARDKYPKHMEFFKGTKTYTFSLLSGGNRTGKSLALAYLTAIFASGIYPKWWEGRKFEKATNIWIVGVDHNMMRTTIERALFVDADGSGKGLIPKELIKEVKYRGKPAGAIDYVTLNCVSGGVSQITFKSCEEGPETFQGAKVNFIGFDEEPDKAVYDECIPRLASGKKDGIPGLMVIASTPVKGPTAFTREFRDDHTGHKNRVKVRWDDVPHLLTEDKETISTGMDPNQREARINGEEYMGTGLVFPIEPTRYVYNPSDVRLNERFLYINGLDTGRQTAAVFAAINPLTRVIYIHSEILYSDVIIPVKAYSLSQISKAPYMADTTMNNVNERDQVSMKHEYEACGLIIRHPNKKLKETFIDRVRLALQAGTLKISRECPQLLDAIQECHRDKHGKIATAPLEHFVDAMLYMMQGIDLAVPGDQIQENYLHHENPWDQFNQSDYVTNKRWL